LSGRYPDAQCQSFQPIQSNSLHQRSEQILRDADKEIQQVFHILNNFDIPVGAVREMHDGVIYSDYTMLTVARDAKNNRFYFPTYVDQTIRMVGLSKFDLDVKQSVAGQIGILLMEGDASAESNFLSLFSMRKHSL
jgi:hypothetical protein